MSNVWIELGLSRVGPSPGPPAPQQPGSDGRASVVAAPPQADPSRAPRLVADLLGVIGDMAPESLGLDTSEFRQNLSQIAEQVTSHPEALTAEMVAECVDHDTFGHPEGDRVLVEIARTLGSTVRPTDLVARYGGDEFVVMLSHTTAAQSQDRLRQIMTVLSNTAVGTPDVVPPIHLTLSIGMTDWAAEDEMADLVGRADQAMYEAKRAGKNRIEVRRRPAKSKLFQNGRPVPGSLDEQPPAAPELRRAAR